MGMIQVGVVECYEKHIQIMITNYVYVGKVVNKLIFKMYYINILHIFYVLGIFMNFL